MKIGILTIMILLIIICSTIYIRASETDSKLLQNETFHERVQKIIESSQNTEKILGELKIKFLQENLAINNLKEVIHILNNIPETPVVIWTFLIFALFLSTFLVFFMKRETYFIQRIAKWISILLFCLFVYRICLDYFFNTQFSMIDLLPSSCDKIYFSGVEMCEFIKKYNREVKGEKRLFSEGNSIILLFSIMFSLFGFFVNTPQQLLDNGLL
jgi:hypothetical protein